MISDLLELAGLVMAVVAAHTLLGAGAAQGTAAAALLVYAQGLDGRKLNIRQRRIAIAVWWTQRRARRHASKSA